MSPNYAFWGGLKAYQRRFDHDLFWEVKMEKKLIGRVSMQNLKRNLYVWSWSYTFDLNISFNVPC